MEKINVFWFRKDLRLEDNNALFNALSSDLPVLIIFIFDTNITSELPADDPGITFIFEALAAINKKLIENGSSLLVMKGDPLSVWKELAASWDINAVFINKEYEPYTNQRDNSVENFLRDHGIGLLRYKDQVIFEEREIVKTGSDPYTVFTPYKNRWLHELMKNSPLPLTDKVPLRNVILPGYGFPTPEKLGFRTSTLKVKPYDLSVVKEYDKYRDYPAMDRTSYLGPHLRFGTVSIRRLVRQAMDENHVFLGELIWREFFKQILHNYPSVVTENFKRKFDSIAWRNDEKEFERWCAGETGYPMVDAGMRQLNETGFMHNRVRMITAGFLCKHLLIDWRWGEAYFAQKLLDYELSSNNGNWQWAAGTGCDAVPYFRIFSPDLQLKRFDKDREYIRKYIPEIAGRNYPKPMVDHAFSRQRAISVYKSCLSL